MKFQLFFSAFFAAFVFSAAFPSEAAQGPDAGEVAKTLRKAVEFYRGRVSTEGGYLWKYSADLSLREGENPADNQTVWVQPPGTPTVGLAFLRAYRVTGDRYYLDAATEAGRYLVRGQLESGGWTYPIHFDPEKRKASSNPPPANAPRASLTARFLFKTWMFCWRF